MKKLLLTAAALMPLLASADNAGKLNITDINVNKGEEQLTLNMTINPKGFHLKSNDVVEIRPMIVADTDTLELPTTRIAGRQAWYAEVRDHKANPLTFARAGKNEPIAYSATVDLPETFQKSQVIVMADTVSVCNCKPPRRGISPIIDMDFRKFEPNLSFHYVAPKDSAVKLFNLSGRANIVFKVNRTEIDWSYAGNQAELDSIMKSINAVRDNRDATVELITLTGYASPEGAYSNNVRLAKGRTEAVKDYVMQHANFPASVYLTNWVPEDWEGLREWIANNSIANRDEMLAFIDDSSVSIEKKNDIFRQKFPKEYPFLLQNVYPSLRHTDYKITYRIRQYYDVAEIREVMRTNPRNLSLNELFLLANSCEPGSEEYDEAFTLAARLFPDNLTANLNAANSAMNRGDYVGAARYLDRAGNSPEADYARAVLALKQGNVEAAKPLLVKASRAGIAEADSALAEIARMEEFQGAIVIL